MGEGCATLAHARWHAEESGISIVAIRLTTERESTGGSNPLPALHCLAATCKPIWGVQFTTCVRKKVRFSDISHWCGTCMRPVII